MGGKAKAPERSGACRILTVDAARTPLYATANATNIRRMTVAELELRVSELLGRVANRQGVESQLTELKASWPDPPEKAARQLAGHANAARGERILWIIGADEKSGTITTPGGDHLQWWTRVQARFDELAPELLLDAAVPYQGQTVRALMFDTRRAPYVVKVEGGDRLEVPWREATGTRSARHSDLIRLLVPQLRAPDVEPTNGVVWLRLADGWRVSVDLYVTPQGRRRVTIPFHRCKAELVIPEATAPTLLANIHLGPTGPKSQTIRGSSSEVVIDGPGMVAVSAGALLNTRINPRPSVVYVKLALGLSGRADPLFVEVGFRIEHTSDGDILGRWRYVATP